MAAVRHQDTGLDAPADLAAAVTKNDGADLPGGPCRSLYIGGAGDVAVITAADASNNGAGTAVTFAGLTAASVLPVRVRRVMSTNTSATSIVALY